MTKDHSIRLGGIFSLQTRAFFDNRIHRTQLYPQRDIFNNFMLSVLFSRLFSRSSWVHKRKIICSVFGTSLFGKQKLCGRGNSLLFPNKADSALSSRKSLSLARLPFIFFYVLKFDIKSCARLFRLRSITSPFLPVGLGINDAMVVELGEEIPSFGWAGRTWSGGGEIRKLLLNSPLRPRAEADGNHSFWLDTLQGL